MENLIKITHLQWYAGVAEDLRGKLTLGAITPMEYYEKLTAALKTAMEQENKYSEQYVQNVLDGFTNEAIAKDQIVTRFEVIDKNGRAYTENYCKVELSYQDDGRTLKVFIKSNKQDNEN